MSLGSIIEELLREVPDYQEFMTVEGLNESSRRLAEEYPDAVKLEEIGRSREGNPILSLRIGRGRFNALLFAFPSLKRARRKHDARISLEGVRRERGA
ncbi:MAG: hypothetical protein DRO05_06990 [Thermoproteota archaeon]|nr:MAG: hypothetical protein DRO05_06990 [Candidatus Korarchaeota archaeon]